MASIQPCGELTRLNKFFIIPFNKPDLTGGNEECYVTRNMNRCFSTGCVAQLSKIPRPKGLSGYKAEEGL